MRLSIFCFVLLFQSPMTLFEFNQQSKTNQWRVVDDGVMGGRSYGNFTINEDGHGEYTGSISLENNGGFSSLRYYFETLDTARYSKFKIRLKGDGKTYQFRVKDKRYNRYAFIYKFKTTKTWQTIEIPFVDMYGSFRGYRIDIPNYKGDVMEEITFLVGNKKAEDFKLIIAAITLE